MPYLSIMKTSQLVKLLIIINCLFSTICLSQDKLNKPIRHYGGGQLGGQSLIAIQYEYFFVSNKYYKMGCNASLNYFMNGDAEYGQDNITGFQTGIVQLAGYEPYFIEVGLFPYTHFYGKTCFVNLVGWFGIRFHNIKNSGFSIGAGYTPTLFTTYSNQDRHLANIPIGLKIGATF